MPDFTGSKETWYTEVFGIPPLTEDKRDKSSLVVEGLGSIGGQPVHLTVFRPTWAYRFQPFHGTETIFTRIFGSGTGGIHVTLEQTNDDGTQGAAAHCYVGGINTGRTDEEKAGLQRILDAYVAHYKAAIAKMCTDYTAFVWQDCDDTDEGFDFLFVDTKEDAFEQIAAIASERHSLKVVYPAQADSALLWNTGSIHPMQSLQNSYQRMVRDAKRPLEGDAASAKESEEMNKYFYFNAQPPKLLGLAADAPPDVATQIEETEKKLSHLEREIPTLSKEDTAKHLTAVNDALWKLRNIFNADTTPAAKKKPKIVPAIASAEKNLKGFKSALQKATAAANPPEELEKIRAKLARAQRDLAQAHSGLCCIQNFHTIEPFYLFRLLVKFQIQSKDKIAATDRTKVSSSLTGLLHNSAHVNWLFEWLRDKLVELDAALAAACPDKGPATPQWPNGEPAVVFFLKGGRAAKYLQALPTKGENDWDTNIVINPNLRAGDWYKNFLSVHNTIVTFLEKAKREFTILMHDKGNYDELVIAVRDAVVAEKKDSAKKATKKSDAQGAVAMRDLRVMAGGDEVALISDQDLAFWAQADAQLQEFDALERRARISDSALEEKETENCKAELIDIGIPRRDAVEAFEQWYNVCPRIIKCPDKIPIPGHLYYVAEYVMMIREAFMDKSISMPKTPKRVIRLLEVLKMTDATLNTLIDEEKHHIPTSLDASSKAVDALALPLKRMLTILLKQFAEAYELAQDPDLAKVFDKTFTKELPNRATKAKYPASLNAAIAAESAYGKDAENKALADAIGFAQWLSEDFGKHLTDQRAAFIAEKQPVLTHFLKALYTASFFSKNDDLEVQFAVTGAFAAQLHATYAGFERMKELEPVKRVDLTIFCKPGADPATVLELIEPLIEKYKTNSPKHKLPNYESTKFGKSTLLLTWPEAHKFSDTIEYKPTVFRISVEVTGEDWPQLAFIKGMPVLGLRDLIWEYKRRAGHVEETFTQRGLKTAIDALVDILTRFENPGSLPWTTTPAPVPDVPGAPDEPDPDDLPPPPDPPKVKEVAGLEFIAQTKSNWCWAATSLMMRKFYLKDKSSLEQVVAEIVPDLSNTQSALQLSRLKPALPVEGRLLTWDEIKAEIDAGRPFIIARSGHFLSCYGYEDGAGTQKLRVWNPLPVGAGAKERLTYAAYTALINVGAAPEQLGATAFNFAISPRKVLIPLRITGETYSRDATSTFLAPTDRTLKVDSCVLNVRHAQNVRGEIGAVIKSYEFAGLPDSFEWDMVLPRDAFGAPRAAFVLQVEATLKPSEYRDPADGLTSITLTLERPA